MLTSGVPRAKKVNAAWEEAGFEYTQNEAEAGQRAPVFNETHADHDGAPEESDEGEENARSDFPDGDGRGRLEDDVGDEEDEGHNALDTDERVVVVLE